MFILVLYRIVRLYKVNISYVFFLVGALCSCMSFVLAESEVLIFSTSNPIFVYNIMLVAFPAGLYFKKMEGITKYA